MEPSEGNQAETTPAVEQPIEPQAEPIQAEDNTAVVETPAEEASPEVKPARKTLWDKLFPFIIVALLFFLGGLVAFYFGLYQPAKQEAKAAADTAAAKIATLTVEFDRAIKQTGEAQVDLDMAKSELQAAQTQVDDLTTQLGNSEKLRAAYKFLADVNTARMAMAAKDLDSSRQAISFAKGDLAELTATGIDANAISGFKTLLEDADKNLSEPELLKSRAALDTLFNNLLLLINNLP